MPTPFRGPDDSSLAETRTTPGTLLAARRQDPGDAIWSPPQAAPEAPCAMSAEAEAALLAAFDAPLIEAPNTDLAFRHKELAVLAVIDALPPIESLALARRLAAARKDDPIIGRLARFEPGRRGRVHAFAADPIRRASRANRR